MLKDPSEIDLLSRIVWMYYKQNMTQSQIAKKFETSRIRVLQLLKRAREEGMVHINITTPLYNCLSIEQKLISTFHLKDALVIPVSNGEDTLRESLGKAAALYLEKHLKNGNLFAVGWGQTISEVVKFINPHRISNLRIVTLVGGLTPSFFLDPYKIGGKLADTFKGKCYYIHAPAITASKELCRSFKSDVTIRQALGMAVQADYSMVSIGAGTAGESTLVKMRYISLTETETLRRQGAVGDILAQFFNIEGKKVDCDLHERIVALPIEDLRPMENVIGLAGGKDKVKAILGTIQGGFIKILITDEETASSLIEIKEKSL